MNAPWHLCPECGSDLSRSSLTENELQVLRLVAEGMLTKQIAEKLFRSEKAIEKRRANLYQKLGVHTALQAVRKAEAMGLIEMAKA